MLAVDGREAHAWVMRIAAWVLPIVALSGCGGSTEQREPEDDFAGMEDEICSEAMRLPCGQAEYDSLAACTTELEQARTEAVADGCGLEWKGLMQCSSQRPLVCDAQGTLALDPTCQMARDLIEQCALSHATPECAGGSLIGGGEETCNVDCPSYSVECSGIVGDLDCKCTAGPRSGSTFQVDSCVTSDDFAAQCG